MQKMFGSGEMKQEEEPHNEFNDRKAECLSYCQSQREEDGLSTPIIVRSAALSPLSPDEAVLREMMQNPVPSAIQNNTQLRVLPPAFMYAWTAGQVQQNEIRKK